jgi:hypothetical protein
MAADVSAFAYDPLDFSVRDDIVAANCRAWERLGRPGTWWTGAERVAIAAEDRQAHYCTLCLARREAPSPESVQGEHEHRGELPEPAIDAIHRITTDPGRLSRGWFERTLAAGLSDGHYVELVGVLVTLLSIDAFQRGLGVAPEPLPEPEDGEPSRYRPARAGDAGAYVPLLPWDANEGDEADLWPGRGGANVLRAMSLVPDEVRQMRDLAATYYIPIAQLRDMRSNAGRALDRPQIELLAGRVSALNECFY